MLQIILQNLIPAMELMVTVIVPLVLLRAIIVRADFELYKKVFSRAIAWGFWGAIFIVIVKLGTKNAVSREVFESIAIIFSLFGEVSLLWLLASRTSLESASKKMLKISISMTTIALLLYHGMEIFLIPVSIVVTADGDYFTLMVLWKLLGFSLGLGIAGIGGYLIYQAALALRDRRLLFVFAIQIVAVLFQQFIFLIQVMMARRMLPGDHLIHIMAPLIDHKSWFIYIVFAVTVVLPIALFLQKKPERPTGINDAQYRQIRIQAQKKLRWGTGAIISLAIMVFFSTWGSIYANKTEELVPAIPITATEGQIQIPLEAVNDGHLHRYVYKASSGELVRFVIIQKGGSSYGVGLDACEICGPTGYLERDGQVICRLCDVMMNKATIGMKGGCNPIPIEYKVSEGNLMVEQAGLEKEKDRFK
ncbi:MAG: Protein of unknown function rane [Massilibacillus sp.]|jgi:uncharacterized membrane protein|nr:Protein of unknown function rane [Massilibacillus sp.]